MTPADLEALEAPTEADALLCAELRGWPALALGPLVVGPGAPAWRAWIAHATPAERVALVPHLPAVPHWALLEAAGRSRLVSYFERCGGQPPDQLDRVTIEHGLSFLGDPGVGRIVVDVLRRLPAAVADRCLTSATWFLGTGRETAGYVATAPPLPALAPTDEALRVVVLDGHLSDQDLAGTVAHEVAHVWLEPIQCVADVQPVGERLDHFDHFSRLVGLADEWRLPIPEGTFTEIEAREHRAVRLAQAWGYHHDDAGRCARSATRLLTQEALHRFRVDRAARQEPEARSAAA